MKKKFGGSVYKLLLLQQQQDGGLGDRNFAAVTERMTKNNLVAGNLAAVTKRYNNAECLAVEATSLPLSRQGR